MGLVAGAQEPSSHDLCAGLQDASEGSIRHWPTLSTSEGLIYLISTKGSGIVVKDHVAIEMDDARHVAPARNICDPASHACYKIYYLRSLSLTTL